MEVLEFFFGRMVFGLLGAMVRYLYYLIIGKKRSFTEIWNDGKGDWNTEGTKNRIIGLIFLVSLVAVISVIISL